MNRLRSVMALLLLLSPLLGVAELKIVATLAPIHSLATAIGEGVATVTLLLPAHQSHHVLNLKPSDLRTLAAADLLIWVGPELEPAIARTLQSSSQPRPILTLSQIEGLTRLPLRTGGVWGEAHGAEEHPGEEGAHAEDPHEAGAIDPHFWLSITNGAAMVRAISQRLQQLDPDHQARYQQNSEALLATLAALRQELATQLAPYQTTPYLLFHDAYHYFEAEFGLQPVGSIALHPDQPMGAKRLQQLREQIQAQQVRCLFSEPQFEPKLVATLTRDLAIRSDTLDPIGLHLPLGRDLYPQLLRQLAQALQRCLTP